MNTWRVLMMTMVACLLLGAAQAADWPQFRGINGDGLSVDVPRTKLEKKLLWAFDLQTRGSSGAVVSGSSVVVTDHADAKDIVYCLKADTGAQLWKYSMDAPDKDYNGQGASPSATPVIAGGRVFTVSAGGDITCLNLATGEKVWSVSLTERYNVAPPAYGFCASPTVVDGKLLYCPGAPDAAIVALDPATGQELWRGVGKEAAYASFCVSTFGGVKQVVTQDSVEMIGWELATGKCLWTVVPPKAWDFNVNTPVAVDGKIFVATDGNFARLYSFGANGVINQEPIATSNDYGPDVNTPVYYKGYLYGTSPVMGLVALDSTAGLKTVWSLKTDGLDANTSLIVGNDHLLVYDEGGIVYLLEAAGAATKLLGSFQATAGGDAYMALTTGVLLLRDKTKLYAYAV
jgi:outer membrane protein assembly factor BamB